MCDISTFFPSDQQNLRTLYMYRCKCSADLMYHRNAKSLLLKLIVLIRSFYG